MLLTFPCPICGAPMEGEAGRHVKCASCGCSTAMQVEVRPTPPPALSIEAVSGVERKERGLAHAEAGQSPQWYSTVLNVVRSVAERQQTLTMEDVRAKCVEYGVPEPSNPNAWGPVLRMAAAEEIVASTDDFTAQERPSAHARQVRVWRSLLYR